MTTQPFEEPSRVHESHKPLVVVTWEGDAGLSAVSPQLPGFSYGRPTRIEFIADYGKVLRDAGVLGDVVGHEQRRFASPEGGEYVIRVAEDEHHAERPELAWRLEAALETEQRHELLYSATNPMGEVTYICCVATDWVCAPACRPRAGGGWPGGCTEDVRDVLSSRLS